MSILAERTRTGAARERLPLNVSAPIDLRCVGRAGPVAATTRGAAR